ncbi:unnamed protein product [Owenia fusiformis]|uniref:Uncharacterized protein n=1 Tax=Owenia fusiformis TaxID=6347 RepID=A0A8J1Y498_OWEFU|nr:unnamed protein product [Owenia fusiformis]
MMNKEGLVALSMIMVSSVHCAMIDMTHTLNGDAVYFPEYMKFNMLNTMNGSFEDAPYVYMNDLELSEHLGTHIDAPVHYGLGAKMLHELKLSELHGPGVVIDNREKAQKDPNAFVDIADLQLWEKEFGEIPEGAVIIQNSGWGKYWGDRDKFVGPNRTDGEGPLFQTPGFHPDAVKWLLQYRDVNGFVVEGISCDSGVNAKTFMAHRVMFKKEKWCVENAANVNKIPQHGSEVYVMPAKIENGSGGPVRMFAIWDEVAPWHNANDANGGAMISIFMLACHFSILHMV